MTTAATQAEKLRNDEQTLRLKTEQRREAGILAFKTICGEEFAVPQDLAEASSLAHRLKTERDNLRAVVKNLESALKDEREKLNHSETGQISVLRSLVGHEPEHTNPSARAAAESYVERLRQEKQLAEIAAKVSANALAQAFIEMGLTQVPGALNVFVGQTPLAIAVEAAAVSLFGDDTVKQNYLRRRGWKFVGNGAWAGPKGTTAFKAAVEIQIKDDVTPYKGLGGREYNPQPKEQK